MQVGVSRGRSTVTNLVEYVSQILKAIEGGGQVDAIYADFSKAFDTVPHTLLLFHLHRTGYGMNEPMDR